MDSIVLRDRNGKKINYHGIDYLNVKTPDGETQGYAAYDPETLVPENLVSGVKVGDVEGALEVPQAVETTIDPDFSAGDMEVVPEDGKVFSKVSIPKPADLIPANIAKDVDIAGVVGTLESGGGGGGNRIPYVVMNTIVYHGYAYGNSIALSNIESKQITLPKGTKIAFKQSYIQYASTTSSSGSATNSITGPTPYDTDVSVGTVSVSENASNVIITVTHRQYAYRYSAYANVHILGIALPGIYCVTQDDGTLCMYADETCAALCYDMKHIMGATKADLSNSSISTILAYGFYFSDITEIIFPATLTAIHAYSMCNQNTTLLDFSKCTAVPKLSATNAIHSHSGLEIRVPAALYSQWKAATNWSTFANYIVAV